MGTFLSYITLSWLHMCFDINLFQAINTKMMSFWHDDDILVIINKDVDQGGATDFG